ncbi:hypothetical protein T11_10893 [Trichinella zimbabwensis]|uniref:Uncharacterized protein n=1 Tax=Trichinella zimbabwensis TaxID=268475 RepID=A0A0V1HVE6_9BILA|nr:hypothetical protein T11_10893 [Trichinella zimbabwensis]
MKCLQQFPAKSAADMFGCVEEDDVGFLRMSKDSELFTYRTMDSWEFWGFGLPQYHPDLSAHYFLLVISAITTVIAGYGFNGVYNMNRTKMKLCGILTLIVILWFTATLTIEAVNKNSFMETTYKTVYTAFLENQYGMEWNFGVFDHIVDNIQQSNKCCGLRKSLNKSQITHPSYYTTLFWLESTNWGQIQQMKIEYNDLDHVPYVPLSCCIDQSVRNCNFALFGDRYGWNKTVDKKWKKTQSAIYNCTVVSTDISVLEDFYSLHRLRQLDFGSLFLIGCSMIGCTTLNINWANELYNFIACSALICDWMMIVYQILI